MAISELTSIRPQQIAPVGTPQGEPAHAVPKAAPKAQADTVELSDQARAHFLKWQEGHEDGTETEVVQKTTENRENLPSEEQTSHSPENPSAAPPPSDPPETFPGEADTEPAKLYEEPQPAGADQARSLRIMGYSVSMIATKMNLDVDTVKQHLGMV